MIIVNVFFCLRKRKNRQSSIGVVLPYFCLLFFRITNRENDDSPPAAPARRPRQQRVDSTARRTSPHGAERSRVEVRKIRKFAQSGCKGCSPSVSHPISEQIRQSPLCGVIILITAKWTDVSLLAFSTLLSKFARDLRRQQILLQRFLEFYGGAGFARCSTFSRRHGTWFVDFCVFMKTILRKHVFFFLPIRKLFIRIFVYKN